MKYVLTALLLVGLIACQDEDIHEAVVPEGELSVLLNGEDYLAQFVNRPIAARDEACFADRFILASQYTRPDGTPRIIFSIVGIPFKPGIYTIRRAEFSADRCKIDYVYANFSTLISDGDVVGDIYRPVEEENNYIAIDTIDLEAQEVSGTFQMTLAIQLSEQDPVKDVPDAPDTIRLTEGRFRVPLIR